MKALKGLLRNTILSIGAVCDFLLLGMFLVWVLVYILKSYVQKKLTGQASTIDVVRGFNNIRNMGEAVSPGYSGRQEQRWEEFTIDSDVD